LASAEFLERISHTLKTTAGNVIKSRENWKVYLDGFSLGH